MPLAHFLETIEDTRSLIIVELFRSLGFLLVINTFKLNFKTEARKHVLLAVNYL